MMKQPNTRDIRFAEAEFQRMGFGKESKWRITEINKDFELCNTYPRFLIVPSSFRDEDLELVAKFRYFRRIPTAVWRHNKNGCFIVRSSQPTVGWFGWFRSDVDEALVQSYVSNIIRLQPSITDISASEQASDNNNHDDVIHKGEIDTSLEKESDGVLTERILNINLVHNGSSSNGHPKADDDKNRLSMLSDSLNGSVERHPSYLADQINNVHETLNDTSLTLYQIATSSRHAATKSADNNSETNGDTNSQAKNLANDVKVLEPKKTQLQLDPSTNFINGNGQSRTENDCTSNSSTKPLSIDSSDNSTSTSVLNDASTNSNTALTAIQQATTSKMLIIDARSYAAAMANRAKGGGCECSEYYQRCEVHFMNLANIHSIRRSYHAIRTVCESYSEQSNNWVSFLDNSRWLHHISGLLKSALLVVDAIDIEEKSVLIHCSDGWDRTPQLVALAETMLDPYYRTFDGFRTLIQREWLDFGHKFADRCGSNPCNEDPNERCPVFLQWLDCVQQLLVQFPESFEFNPRYLDKLNRHTYSNIFSTFSYNSCQERTLSRIVDRMGSLWAYFDASKDKYRNKDFVKSNAILRPSHRVKDLHFWKEVYLPPVNHPKNQQTASRSLTATPTPATTPTSTPTPITSLTPTPTSTPASANTLPNPLTTTSPSTTTPVSTTPNASSQTNIDNNKCSRDSLYIDGLTRTVCK